MDINFIPNIINALIESNEEIHNELVITLNDFVKKLNFTDGEYNKDAFDLCIAMLIYLADINVTSMDDTALAQFKANINECYRYSHLYIDSIYKTIKAKTDKPDLNKMSKAELIQYIKDNVK